jgi:hypothetical protein
MRCTWLLLWVLTLCLAPALGARADVLQAPVGGRPIPLGDAGVSCSTGTGGWVAEIGGRTVRPPTDSDSVGRAVELRVAPTVSACTSRAQHVTLVATDRWPSFDLPSLVLYADEGRLDGTGRNLLGVTLSMEINGEVVSDTCRNAATSGRVERCTWAIGRNAPADPAQITFRWQPAGASNEPNVVTFDAGGRRALPDVFMLAPARVIIARLLPTDAKVDLATGQGEVPLVRPEAVASAECSPLPCTLEDKRLTVRGGTRLVNSLEVRLKLRPQVFLQRREALETAISEQLPVLHCPMAIVSGPPVRNNSDAKVIVKLERGCARDLNSVRFMLDQRQLRVLRTVNLQDESFVLLRLGRIDVDEVVITAVRGERDAIALAVTHAATRTAPQVRATLELPGYPNLSFIPNNRAAAVHTSSPGENQTFAVLPIEGIYSVHYDSQGRPSVRANPNAAGLTSLVFGLRMEGLPAGLDQVDLAVVQDPLQRGMGEANIPAPIDVEPGLRPPLIEVLCGGGNQKLHRLEPGVTAHLSYELRDSCRVVFHRERLSSEYGTQRLNFEIDVLRPDGSPKGGAHVSEVISMRAGHEPRYAFIRGITEPFDRLIVRVSHVADESHYIGASELRTGSPAAQWSAVFATGRLRLYGTTTIPTGLYRYGAREYSGVLQLNFGVLSRLTWLDKHGREGVLGAELGLMVIGVANSVSDTGQSLRQLGAVTGIGLSVPIANRSAVTQASINVHAWLETNLARDVDRGGRYAFIFGPSITIGNVGVNL